MAIDAEALGFNEETCVEKVMAFKPQIVGISSTTPSFYRALTLARHFKEKCPGIPLILGGNHVTSNPEHALSFDLFSYGVIGEGEETLRCLVEALEAGNDPREIEGIAYRNESGALVCTPRRKLIENLDAIPFPAYDLIPKMSVYTPPPHRYMAFPVANIITSRGCPNACTFCEQNVFGRKLRQHSAEHVVDEIVYLYKNHHVREISFNDDTFTINFERIRKIFDALTEQGIKLSWSCTSRINNVTRDEIAYMKRSGCWRIAFGIESGDKEILKRIRKNITLEQVREVIGWCRELGVVASGFFMLGHPGETKESIEKTIAFALSLPLTYMTCSINTPFPGSPQYQDIKSFGTLDDNDWSKFNQYYPVFVPSGLTSDLLARKNQEINRRFYLRPRTIYAIGKTFFNATGAHRAWQMLLILPYLFFG